MIQPYCIDLYHNDNVIDQPGPFGGFAQVKAQGIAFLDHKASDGPTFRDPRLAARYTIPGISGYCDTSPFSAR